ncbi:MAG: LytTR family DNA-binding domain-containing protein [Polyangiaceae bacterium]|nr:LytTR family DNA-binding domain-containing protein [Polyangiaceae bacterium]
MKSRQIESGRESMMHPLVHGIPSARMAAGSIPLRVVVCDDELMARRRVLRLLGELSGIEATFECESGEQVLAELRGNDVDVALLDINMPGLSGIETVLAMPEERPYVIFLTAHPEHAVKAFDVGAVDYLLKPVDGARLDKALHRARRFLDGQAKVGTGEGASESTRARTTNKLAIVTRSGIELVTHADVTHATFDGALVTVHTTTRTILTDDTLQDLEAKLPPGPFERVHRRALVNLDHVERLEPLDSGGYCACISTGKKVDVSRQSARRLRRRLGLR